MQMRRLGTDGPGVSALGLGCMGMSDFYGPADEAESLATIREAMDAGVTLLDTGDFYGSGHNELLLREALRDGRRDQAFLSVKFGGLRDPKGGFTGIDNRPASVKNFLAYSLKRLGTDHVDLYQPARLDPAVPIEETVGAIAQMIRAGYVRHLGLSEVSAETIRRAHAVHPVAAIQIEYSIMSRGIEAEILPTCRELGIAVTAYGVLSRGLLSGRWHPSRAAAGDFRAHLPRFTGENFARNQALVEALAAVAADVGATPAQVAIAWVAGRGDDIIPLIGARTRERLRESLGVLNVRLDAADLARVEAAVPADAVAGTRYMAPQMRLLDSEPKPAGRA
ncbi:aldo/keto reductase [Tundrisphaera sp. TA3]|uniref:aldo/keto reductase n=1 Tax=Tundrisphaera sp. TA3 TaxID=3435775 RepID=UPI003EBFC6BF